jgi:GntR family transcriptional regulator/MocR family aminotransferase
MHVVVWLRGYDEAQAQELIELAHSQGLGLYPMAPHYASAQARQGLLLGYCGLSAQELHDAMQLFGHCLDELEERMALRPARRRGQGV